jgi:hypothetical protein
MRSFLTACSLVVLAALGAAGCNDDTATTPTTPTTTTTVTDSFSGTLSRNGASTFSFAVGATGQVTATLTTLAAAGATALPDGTVVGISLGNWNGTTCQTVLANDKALQGTFVTGTMSKAGDLCVRVYDSTGELGAAATFKIDVVHP